MSRIQARAFVFATGANDLVPLFENNDLPGIFGERAIRLFLERDDFRPGRRAVVYGIGTPLFTTATLLLHHDIELVALVDPVGSATPDERQHRALDRVRMVTGMTVRRAKGKAWLGAVELSPRAAGEKLVLECDLLCVALPGQPAFELAYQAGFEFALSDAPLEACRVMRPASIRRESDDRAVTFLIAGEAAGETDWRKKIESGDQAGREAARALRA